MTSKLALATVAARVRHAVRTLFGNSSPEPGDAPVPAKAGDNASAQHREKRPLQRDLPPPGEFPVEALGEILGNAALALTDAIQAPLAICGNAVLAAAHLAVQAHADVEIDGRVHPISENFVTVGETGERKTAVDNETLREHRAYEKRLHDAAPPKRTTGPDGPNDTTFDPLDPIVLCEEPTFPALINNLAKGHPSQGLFSDEGGRFLGGHAMNTENALATVAGLSRLWDGKPIDRVRVGDGAIKLYGRRFSCHLMGQPAIMASLIADPKAQAQGFLSRCLIVTPESKIGARLYRGVDLSQSDAMIRYHARLRALLERKPAVEDANHPVKRAQLTPRRLIVSSQAKRIYVDFHDSVELAMAGPLKELRAFANKAPEHLLRVAGALALVEDPDATEIAPKHAASSRVLIEYYLREAHRINEIACQDGALTLAQRLLQWIDAIGRPVSLVEIYQRGPNPLRNAADARRIARILVEHGHIEPVRGIVYDGRRRSEAWRLRR